jgi:DNA-binding CsgD family transcriptional regulator/tetratricopeptide (TPR) repeat protein
VAVVYAAAESTAPGTGVRRVAGLADDAPASTPASAAQVFGAAGAALARQPGGAVLLDDLQWADDLTLDWLAQAGPMLAATRTVVVATVRAADDLPDRVGALAHEMRRGASVERLHVRPLGRDAVREVAEALVGPVDDTELDRLWQLTDGLPLFVEEVLNRSAPLAAGPADEPRLTTLLAVVREQVAALDPVAADLTALAAVAPEPVEHALFATVLDAAAADALYAVHRAGLLVGAGLGRSRFRHALVRDCVYASIDQTRRRQLHAWVADWLAGRPSGVPRTVAAHYEAAGDPVNALRWHRRAARNALELADSAVALDACVAALRLARDHDRRSLVELADETATAARLCGQTDRALVALDETAAVLPPRKRGRVLLARARVVSAAGDMDGRVRALTGALAAFESSGDQAGVARALAELAYPAGNVPPLAERLALGRRAVAAAATVGDPAVAALAQTNLAAVLTRLGRPAQALRHYDASVREAARCEPFSAAQLGFRVYYNRADALINLGEYDAAAEALAAARVAVADAGGATRYELCEAVRLWRCGSWDAAVTHARRALAGERQPDAWYLHVVVGAISAERDRVPNTHALEAAADAAAEEAEGEWAASAVAELIAVRAQRHESVPPARLDAMARRIAAAGTRYSWEDLPRALALLDHRQAKRFLALVGDLRPVSRRADATLAMVDGLDPARDPAERLDLLAGAAERFAALPEPFLRAQCLDRAADAATAAGRRPGALRREAAELYESLGAHASLARLLRRSHGSRAVAAFAMPAAHRHRGALGLTERERDVARLAAQGYTTREIAVRLGIAASTVRSHLDGAKRKLGVRRMRDLARAGEAVTGDGGLG